MTSEKQPHDPGLDDLPSKPSKKGERKPERPPSNNVLWYLIIGGVIVAATMVWMSNNKRGTEIKLGEFEAGLEPASPEATPRFNKNNVFNLKFGTKEITFQDQPEATVDRKKALKGEVPEQTQKSINKYYIPIFEMGDVKQNELTDKLNAKGIVYGFKEGPSEWYSVAYLLFIPLMFVLFFIILFRRMGGAGSAMSFGRSRGRMHAQEDLEVTFDDVAGINEAVDELREVVEFLRTPGKYQALGGRIPRGVLLVGPPGTGKTLLAKAVAGEAGVPFYSLSGSDFVEMFVGVGAARVRDMFQQAGHARLRLFLLMSWTPSAKRAAAACPADTMNANKP